MQCHPKHLNAMKIYRTLSCIFRPSGADAALLFLRLAAGGTMLTHGIAKISAYSQMSAGFPDLLGLGGGFSFTLIMLTESLGALLVMLGLLTRAAALALVFGMGVAAFVAHAPVTLTGSELPLLYLFVFAAMLISGGGRYSLDAMIWKKQPQGK